MISFLITAVLLYAIFDIYYSKKRKKREISKAVEITNKNSSILEGMRDDNYETSIHKEKLISGLDEQYSKVSMISNKLTSVNLLNGKNENIERFVYSSNINYIQYIDGVLKNEIYTPKRFIHKNESHIYVPLKTDTGQVIVLYQGKYKTLWDNLNKQG